MNEEDDEDDKGIGVSKYPCMPSLVTLLQMRNRLHLAYIGKKLMKWTAMATGRELRKISQELTEVYDSFKTDYSNAFMLLARCRYFYPNMNSIVVENIPRNASVTVGSTMRAITGVRVFHMDIRESGVEPYEHLGIEKGGHAIQAAKEAWLKILRRIILMVELRSSFEQVEFAHKCATKRSNVMKKIVIPKLNATIRYILQELEEIAREELYRIKMIKLYKLRNKNKHASLGPTHVCPICSQVVSGKKPAIPKAKPSVDTLQAPPTIKKIKETMKMESRTKVARDISRPRIGPIRSVRVEEREEMYRPLSSKQSREPMKLLSLESYNPEEKLAQLRDQLVDVILQCKDFVVSGIHSVDVGEMLKACERAKIKIDTFVQSDVPPTEVDDNLKMRLDHLKLHLREVISVTHDFRDGAFLSPSMENFIRTCEEVDEKICVYMKKVESQAVTDGAKSRLTELKSHINDVVKLTETYKHEGLLTPSVENFLQTCEHVKARINAFTKETEDPDKKKLDHLKEHVTDMEKVAADVKKEGMISTSMEDFLSSCKDFKAKLEDYKNRGKKPPHEGGLGRLVGHINETIELSKQAKEGGLMSESVENFIKSCETVKKIIETKQKQDSEIQVPTVLDDLKYNLDDVIKLISECRADGLISKSVEEFLKTCEREKLEVEVVKRFSPEEADGKMLYAPCSESCACNQSDGPLDELCPRCIERSKEKPRSVGLPASPCDTCTGIIREPPSEEELCLSCNREPFDMSDYPEYVSPEESQDKVCEICKKHLDEGVEECHELHAEEEEVPEEQPEAPPPGPVDSSLGYFEKKVRKITKVKRSQNRDGTIREEKETILVKKEKHDPNETTLEDDENELGGDVSYESLLDPDDKKKVGMCLVSDQRGFAWQVPTCLQKSKSDVIIRSSGEYMKTRPCISLIKLIQESSRNTTPSTSKDIPYTNSDENTISHNYSRTIRS